MARTMTVLAAGALLGMLAMHLVARFNVPGSPREQVLIVRDIVSVPAMTQAAASQHREERYARIQTVQDLMALPSEFARTEALHVLAGRADAADLQAYLFDANRVADDIERERFIEILFFRLTEVDPQSALALARTRPFDRQRSTEYIVWRTWARRDLDDALIAAQAQAGRKRRDFAAQSLYAAFGYLGNDTTARIGEVLGIEPGTATRRSYIRMLADRSPAEAVAFVNGLERGSERKEYVNWIASHLALRDADSALQLASRFNDASDGERFTQRLQTAIARENPQAALAEMFAAGTTNSDRGQFHAAASALVQSDIEAAISFFERARSPNEKQTLGSVIVNEMAKNDPVAALAWAKENETSNYPYLQMTVLGELATTNPELAMAEALKQTNIDMRSALVSNVVQRMAMSRPENAVALLDQVPAGPQREQAIQSLASSWLRKDPDAAVNWILRQDKATGEQLTSMMASMLPQFDIDTAMRTLPRLSGQHASSMRQHIARILVKNRSPEEAQAFIQQFAGQPGYEQLQASVITGMARSDVVAAANLADHLSAGPARDRVYIEIIRHHDDIRPRDAQAWLNRISNDTMRGVAAGQLATRWHQEDPAAAVQWANTLPAGSLRDNAIMHLSGQWRTLSPEQEALVDSIGNAEVRSQAQLRQLYNVMQRDPAKARAMLDELEIPDFQRQQIEMMLSRFGQQY